MHCRSESATTGEGRFRVNANGNLLDVWLLVRCVSCDRTSKLTVHERAPVRSFDPAELDGYHANDPELVASRLLDPLLARRNRFTLDWKGAWRLDTPSAWRAEAWPVKVEVVFEDPVPVRPERLIGSPRPFRPTPNGAAGTSTTPRPSARPRSNGCCRAATSRCARRPSTGCCTRPPPAPPRSSPSTSKTSTWKTGAPAHLYTLLADEVADTEIRAARRRRDRR
jgi:hypothetical protein